MTKYGTLKGTVLKIMMLNGKTLDMASIERLVSKELPETSYESIRACVYNLVKDEYLEKVAKGMYKVTDACVEGAVNGPMSQFTVQAACTTDREN